MYIEKKRSMDIRKIVKLDLVPVQLQCVLTYLQSIEKVQRSSYKGGGGEATSRPRAYNG